ncbi:MAG TPA: hypothetical protein VHG35_16510 [Gemmatimonadales bacterium]|nr:hypothetical protein [Gemmatimonadales bacterium]
MPIFQIIFNTTGRSGAGSGTFNYNPPANPSTGTIPWTGMVYFSFTFNLPAPLNPITFSLQTGPAPQGYITYNTNPVGVTAITSTQMSAYEGGGGLATLTFTRAWDNSSNQYRNMWNLRASTGAVYSGNFGLMPVLSQPEG